MPDLNVLAVLVATVAAFVSGAVYYAVFGKQLAARSRPCRRLAPKLLGIAVIVSAWQS